MDEFDVSEVGDYGNLLCFVASMFCRSVIDFDRIWNQIFHLTTIRVSTKDAVLRIKEPIKKTEEYIPFQILIHKAIPEHSESTK